LLSFSHIQVKERCDKAKALPILPPLPFVLIAAFK